MIRSAFECACNGNLIKAFGIDQQGIVVGNRDDKRAIAFGYR